MSVKNYASYDWEHPLNRSGINKRSRCVKTDNDRFNRQAIHRKQETPPGDSPAKPSKQELLAELESIRSSLIETATLAKQTQNFTPGGTKLAAPTQTSLNSASSEAEVLEHTMPVKPEDESQAHVLPGQQSLFDMVTEEDKNPSLSAPLEAQTAKPENPFLPQHVKERLAKEKEYYQRELESVTKLSFGMKHSLSPQQCEAVVDALVARYLPKIEEDLRNELHKLLEKEHEPS